MTTEEANRRLVDIGRMIKIMTELVEKKQVEIELTITPDQQQVVSRPWKPLEWQTSYKTKDA